MLTSKQLRQIATILTEESAGPVPTWPETVRNYVENKPTPCGPLVRISSNGRIEGVWNFPAPESKEAHSRVFAKRLVVRKLVRIITRLTLSGIPVGFQTQEWMQNAVHARDLALEAEECLRAHRKSLGLAPR